MWTIMEKIAEERIREAMERGEFENLEGAGKPLVLEDDSLVPEDLRMAYKILRNSGHLPEEVILRKEIQTTLDLLETLEDETERYRQIRKLECLKLRMGVRFRRPLHLEEDSPYYAKVVERIQASGRGKPGGQA